AENCMKPSWIHPERDRWDFVQADAVVEFARDNHLHVFGHTLMYPHLTSDWFLKENGENVSREQALERLKIYIDTVVGRYKGQIDGWDVVNEPIADGGYEDLRPNPWLETIGPDYIQKAFEYAHAADPNAVLSFNDYNIELPYKRVRAIRL